MADLVHDLAEVEHLIGREQREMGRDIAKRPDAEHAAHIDQIAVARDVPQRRYRERHAQEHQRPETGAVDQVVERARAVQDRLRIDQRLGERKKQQGERAQAQRRQAAAPVAPKLPTGLSSPISSLAPSTAPAAR